MLSHPPIWFDWFVVLSAILFSPVLAVFAQRLIDRLREKKDRRVACYLTLMSLRASPLHPDHVRAVNSIDTIFDGNRGKDVRIREAWGKVLQHLSTDAKDPGWAEKLTDLHTDLYQAVGKAVGYDHSVDYLKTRIYNPQRYLDMENDNLEITHGLAKALSEGILKVKILEEKAEVQKGAGA